MKNIGLSINEAIDWTQDRLNTTRPLAERTLFSLFEAEIVEESEDGFLIEAEEETEKHYHKVKQNFTKNWQRYRFHAKRKTAKKRFFDKRQQQQRNLDQDDDSDSDSTSSDCDKVKHIEIS